MTNWQELIRRLLETTTEFLEQHTTSNEDIEEEKEEDYEDEDFFSDDNFYVSFCMNTEGTIECDILWPKNLPSEVVGPAVASLLNQINNGELSDLCIQTITSSCDSIEDAMVNSAIISHLHLMNEDTGANASVDPERVLDINRIDGE